MKLLKFLWDRSFTNWRYRGVMHIVFWLFLLFFWLQESMVVKITLHQHYLITLTGIVLSLFLFYPLVYIIVPLYQRKKYLLATIAFVMYYIVAILLRTYHIDLLVEWYNDKHIWFAGQDFWVRFYKSQLRPLSFARSFFSSLTSLLEIIFVPLIIKFSRYAYTVNASKAALEKENILLELNFLKAQLNPHFLFNTLNNLQSFIVHGDSGKSVELLNKLSALMRFSLYECNAELIALQKEAVMIENYIDIERVRYEDEADISYNIKIDDATIQVPSLLLMPLVENAFKFSATLPAEDVAICIKLHSHHEMIEFFVSNHYYTAAAMPNGGGIGLQNVRKRLEHYYNKRHSLQVTDDKNIFTVKITILPYALHNSG